MMLILGSGLLGKKFDPTAFEDALVASSEYVDDAIVFGSQRPVPGLFVFVPRDKADALGFDEVGRRIWQQVKICNDSVEKHSRIAHDMLRLFNTGDYPIKKSSKGTILRGPTTEGFQAQIEELYQHPGSQRISSDLVISDSEMQSTVREIVNEDRQEGAQLHDHAGFFESGIDSMRASQIRSLLQRQIMAEKELPANVVYDCGSISR